MMPGGGVMLAEMSSLLTVTISIDFVIWKQCKKQLGFRQTGLDVSIIPSCMILGVLLNLSKPQFTHL